MANGVVDFGYMTHAISSLLIDGWYDSNYHIKPTVQISGQVTVTNSFIMRYGYISSSEESGTLILNGTSSFEDRNYATGSIYYQHYIDKTIACTVVNNGALTWSNGPITLVDAGRIINSAMATFSITTYGWYSCYDGTYQYWYSCTNGVVVAIQPSNSQKGTFDNYGLVAYYGTIETVISVPFNNNGTLISSGGETYHSMIILRGGGNSSGIFRPESTSEIVLDGRESMLSVLSEIRGTGRLQVNGAEHYFYGTLNVSSGGLIDSTAGKAHFLEGFNFASLTQGTIRANGGYVVFHYCVSNNAPVLTVANGIFDLGSLAHNILKVDQSGGTLTGTANVTITSTYNFHGGLQSGTGRTIIAPGAQLLFTGGTSVFTRNIENNGNAYWTAGYIQGGSGATFLNNYNATFYVNPSSAAYTFTSDSASKQAKFINLGRVTRSQYAVMNMIGLEFHNVQGSVIDPIIGSIALGGGGECKDAYVMPVAPGKVEFYGGFHMLNESCYIGGDGTIQFSATGAYHVHAQWNNTGIPVVTGGTVTFRTGIQYMTPFPGFNMPIAAGQTGGIAIFEEIPFPFPPVTQSIGMCTSCFYCSKSPPLQYLYKKKKKNLIRIQ